MIDCILLKWARWQRRLHRYSCKRRSGVGVLRAWRLSA